MQDNDIKRLSRLTSILTQLQTKRLITATALANKFHVSVRTIYRDIKALEQSGVPIITQEGKGYRLMDGYRMPPIMFTESEANALITAEQFVLKNKDASFVNDYSEAIGKIKAVLRQATKDNANLLSGRIGINQNASADRTSNWLSTLQLALTNFNLTYIGYQKPDSKETTLRAVEPFALLCGQDNWLLVAWCRLRDDFRIFRLDRISHVQIQDEKFKPHQLSLEEYLASIRKKQPLT